MSASLQAKSDKHLDQADECPWYSVEIVGRGGPGHWGCRAHNADEAEEKALRAHQGMGVQVGGAEFDKLHLENRIPKSETRIYRGVPLVACETHVYVRLSTSSVCNDLDPRLDLANHSPTVLSWGYEGSGPAQLSLALLADALEDDERALRLYQAFKRSYIATIPQEVEWWLSTAIVRIQARHIERQLEVGLIA